VSPQLRWFLLFLVVLGALLIATAIFLGPNILGFVFHEERRTAPFVMVNLLDFRDAGAIERFRHGDRAPLMGLIDGFGGRPLWTARLDRVVAGGEHDRWGAVALVEYPSRAAFVDMVTGGEYRAGSELRSATFERTALLAGTSRTPFVETPLALYALRFIQFSSGKGGDDFLGAWLPKEADLLQRHGAIIVWDARLNLLVGATEDEFDHVLLAGFPDEQSLREWVDDPERGTMSSLERRYVRRDVVLALHSAP